MCVFDTDMHFFQSINRHPDMGVHMTNVTRPMKDVFVSYNKKVM